jgi:hypothetical protein
MLLYWYYFKIPILFLWLVLLTLLFGIIYNTQHWSRLFGIIVVLFIVHTVLFGIINSTYTTIWYYL